MGLVCYALDDSKFNSARMTYRVNGPEGVAEYRANLLKKLDQEFEKCGARAVILSNEHLSSRLHASSEIARLKELCDRYARKTTVIVYLRNQVDFLCSRYVESVKGGSTRPFPFPIPGTLAILMDYARVLAPWGEAFGSARLAVRRFEAGDFLRTISSTREGA